MASRRFPRLLNAEGQRRIEEAFRLRVRPKGGHIDMADAYIRALQDHGLLDQYLIPRWTPSTC